VTSNKSILNFQLNKLRNASKRTKSRLTKISTLLLLHLCTFQRLSSTLKHHYHF